MAQAQKLQARAEQQAKVAAQANRRGRRGTLAGKTFEQLTQPQKDMLLKQVAIQLGLIEDSSD